jgi:hypothetical protein
LVYAVAIISGVIVFLITNLILSKKENKLYNQRIIQANNEFVIIIKPIIIEKNKFNNDLFDSLKIAISKKYNIDKNDMYTINDLTSLIITDILQTPFLTGEQKENYCNEIIIVKNNIININRENKISEKIIIKNTLSSKYISSILGIVTVLFSLISMSSLINEIITIDYSIIIILQVTIIPIMAILVVSFIQKYIKSKNKDMKEKILENNATAHNKR